MGTGAFANNMLVQNVTTLGNDAVNKTIQVQFDISWDNSWRDSINYDAAWIFMKFKDASGVWQHVQLNQTGFVAGTGTANTVQVTNDKVGCWLYRTSLGSGTFTSTGMQLQWNYGLAGLNSVTGLEVRVFAVEMVYVPEGEFNCAGDPKQISNSELGPRSFVYSNGSNARFADRSKGFFYAPGQNFPVVNSRLSPTLTYNDGVQLLFRVKGDTGFDFNNDGIIENSNFPSGFKAAYYYKYELTEQQYADFLNTLTVTQINNVGIAGSGLISSNGQYFSSSPNKSCIQGNSIRLLAYADWSGVRPMTFLEFNKACFGPFLPEYNDTYIPWNGNIDVIKGYPVWGNNNGPTNILQSATNAGSSANSSSTRYSSGASYFGIMELTGSVIEPVVRLHQFQFSTINGDGNLTISGNSDTPNWSNTMLLFIDNHESYNYNSGNAAYTSPYLTSNYGFRYVRSAE
jgi:hypothetical protein